MRSLMAMAVALTLQVLTPTLFSDAAAQESSADKECENQTTLHVTTEDCKITGADIQSAMSSGDGHTYTVEPECAHLRNEGCREYRVCTINGDPGNWYTVFRDGDPYARVCLTRSDAVSLGAVTPALVLTAMRRLEWPRPELTVQPTGGRTLVNLETIFYTTLDAATTRTVTLLGRTVQIQARPTSYLWHPDDGLDPWQTDDPGQPWHHGADITELNHAVYTRTTTAHPWVEVVYAGRYRVGDGPWRTIPETLTLSGPRQTLQVVEATPVLVAPAGD